MYSKINAKIFTPDSFESYFELISKLSDYMPVAGGTDVIVKIKRGKIKCANLILLNKIKELKEIRCFDNHLFIGAGNTFSRLLQIGEIKDFQCLIQSFRNIGSPQIRNMATIGGNIVNASPAADSLPALMLYSAVAVVKGKNNRREIKLSDFFNDSYSVKLEKHEILTGVKIYKSHFKKSAFIKVGKRKTLFISRINIALGIDENNRWRIFSGAVTPFPVRMPNAEEVLASENITPEKIEKAVSEDILAHTDFRPSFRYKFPVLRDLLLKFKKIFTG